MKYVRNILGSFWFIHLLVILGLFSMIGAFTGLTFILFFTVLSFAGAICGAFIRVIDAVKKIDLKN